MYRILILFLIGCLYFNEGTGVYGESESDYGTEHQEVALTGDWEFYWKRLLTPEQLKQSELTPIYMHVPGQWGGQETQGESFGYGTYRLQVNIPQADIGRTKVLFIGDIGSAYNIWIDGQKYDGLGVVGTRSEEETAEMRSNFVQFIPRAETAEVLIQVSNFSFREGGVISELAYGNIEAMVQSIIKELLVPALMIGGLFTVGLYYLIIYGIRRNEPSHVYIGLLAWAITLRCLFLSEYLVHILFLYLKWELMVKIEYLSEVFSFAILILLMKHLYPQEFTQKNIQLFYAIITLLNIYILVTPARIYTSTMLVQYAIMAVAMLFYVFYIGIAAVLRRREGARINLIGLLILVIAGCNDTLYYLKMIPTVELVDYAVIVFVLMQAMIVSYRYSILFNENTLLTSKLLQFNQSLEEKVAARTEDLHHKNEDLSKLHQTKTKMLANISHDLGSPITGIHIYLQLMKEGRIQSGDKNVIELLLEKATYIKRLNHDLFELSKLESKQLSFKFERVSLQAFIDEVYHSFANSLRRDQMELHLGKVVTMVEGCEGYVYIDSIRIKQVLQNIIGNAVKFSRSSCKPILLNCYVAVTNQDGNSEHHAAFIEVIDYGPGITEGELPQVFNRFYKRQEGNTDGTGLGLTISKEIIEQHQGTIGVVSEMGKGSTFYFSLPLQ